MVLSVIFFPDFSKVFLMDLNNEVFEKWHMDRWTKS